ncbi:MAG: hypothetical protein IJU31_01830 [Synergistaceae bacterium]|nr:hypothetical protein [Synergistaceae bacterium]
MDEITVSEELQEVIEAVEAEPEPETPPPEETPKEEIYDIEKYSGKVFYELREIHKLCQNFYAGRMHAAEQELEKYHDIEAGRAFDGILKQIAQIYINNENLPEKIEDEKASRKVSYILLDLLQILEEYGIHTHKSSEGDKISRFVSSVGYVETDEAEKNGTIAQSVQTGFYRENSPLMRELVKLYRKENQ